jgi:hypothetical protein
METFSGSKSKVHVPRILGRYQMDTDIQARWHTTVILALGSLRQEDLKFDASLDYIMISCLKKIQGLEVWLKW